MATPSRTHIEALDVFVELLSATLDDDLRDAFYSRLCEAICRQTSMERAIIFRYDAGLRRVRAAGAHNIDLALFSDAHVDVESAPVARRALEEDRVIEVREDRESVVPPEYVSVVAEAGPLVCAPMAAAGRWVGVVLAQRAPGAAPLGDEERDLLWTLGKIAALASIARIATTQSEKARQLQTRIDLARDIHDRVVQQLFGVSLALSSEEGLTPEEQRRCAEEVQSALADLREAVQRPLSRVPRPSQATLGDVLARLAREHADLGVVLESGDPADIPAALEPLAQSVLAEAVRNAHKHATPTRVAVNIAREDGAFVLTIVNDGVRERSGGTGMGLRLAALEALHSGGVVEFGRLGADHWQVKLVVPYGDG